MSFLQDLSASDRRNCREQYNATFKQHGQRDLRFTGSISSGFQVATLEAGSYDLGFS